MVYFTALVVLLGGVPRRGSIDRRPAVASNLDKPGCVTAPKEEFIVT